MFEKLQTGERIHDAPRQPLTCSHLIYARMLTGVCQAIRIFSPCFFVYLYPQEPQKVTYYLEVLLVEPNGHCVLLLLKTLLCVHMYMLCMHHHLHTFHYRLVRYWQRQFWSQINSCCYERSSDIRHVTLVSYSNSLQLN